MKKAIVLLIIAGLIVIQFFHPPKNIAGEVSPAAALSRHYAVPADVQTILKAACYDCHSDNTEYPAYYHIQPIAWWMNRHIRKGKKALNFDRFYAYSLKHQDHKLKEIIEMLQEDKMPLKSYRLLHEEAQLTEGQKQKIIDWARMLREDLIISGTATPS